MPKTVSREQALVLISELVDGTKKLILVAVDGHGGAGKSDLASWLGAHLHGQIIHIDDFGRPGRPYEAWDWDRFQEQVLEPFTAGRPARFQRYDWESDRLAEWLEVSPHGVVIAEGVSVSRSELGDTWDLKIWVEAPYDLRLARGIERDGEEMRSTWVEHWIPQEDHYVELQRPQERADVVVLGYEPDNR